MFPRCPLVHFKLLPLMFRYNYTTIIITAVPEHMCYKHAAVSIFSLLSAKIVLLYSHILVYAQLLAMLDVVSISVCGARHYVQLIFVLQKFTVTQLSRIIIKIRINFIIILIS